MDRKEGAMSKAVRTGPKEAATVSLPGLTPKLEGSEGRLFADPHPGGDEPAFQVENTSAAYYKSQYYEEHKEDLQQVPAPRESPPHVDLADIVGTATLAPHIAGKRISFHAVGDTGASSEAHLGTEARVADAMAEERSAATGVDVPTFLFHLGDVVYSFGEPQYYYDQFYEPFRGYDAPILAIPGNHDGFPEQGQASLFAFLRNFCTSSPERSPDSGGLMRSTMTQPGVYFTLDAPFVSIIGLYSNVLEGPGVISSEGGVYPIGDQQLEFLIAELERLKPLRESKSPERAVILAVHHPPLSVDRKHGGTRGLANDIDQACERAGMWPDVVLSGHAHLYQRFNRTNAGTDLPYIVAGSGGHNVGLPPKEATPLPQGYELAAGPWLEYGYLTLTVDLSEAPPTLKAVFNPTSGKAKAKHSDSVTLDLSTRKLIP
jgi:Calcineurin-like phosphoesterase